MNHIRWMIRRDLGEVAEIERGSFPVGQQWTEESFLRCLGQRNVIGMVSEHEDQVVGYMVYELFEREIQLLNLAVHPRRRTKGAGRGMLDRLKGKLNPSRRYKLSLDVREENLGAQLFLRSCNFRAVKVLGQVYRMEFRLPEAEMAAEEAACSGRFSFSSEREGGW